jgi:hypothetical protein
MSFPELRGVDFFFHGKVPFPGMHCADQGEITRNGIESAQRRMEMKTRFLVLTLLWPVFFVPTAFAGDPQWNFGISAGPEGLSGFHLSVGNHYQVPQREVVVVRERGISEDELPVVFFLARHAHVPPHVVMDLRLHRRSWQEITLHLGLSPEIFYVPVKGGPPHGHAYGHYKKHPKGGWGKVRLSDAEIVNQVNLHFLSRHYGYDPARIMKMREHGTSFVNIERKIARERGHQEARHVAEHRERDRDWQDNQGKDRDRDRDRDWDRGREDRIPPGHRKK